MHKDHRSDDIRAFTGAFIATACLILSLLVPNLVRAAPSAAVVMDMRTGQVYLNEDADKQLHPASLTKMMTLYIAFQAAASGDIDLDAQTTVSSTAASVPGSSLNLSAGERISLRDLVTATAIKSANDAATALAEAIGGDTKRFVARMNATAARIGMTRTHFRNAHGLTAEGHLSTARDMSLLGRQLFFDHPEFFDLFSKVHASSAGRKIAHTNRRFLGAYSGADGIKTGYTRAAGYNLTASAHRGKKRLIVTVFGASSSADRTARVATLMNKGFRQAPELVKWIPPAPTRQTRPKSKPLLVSAPAPDQSTVRLSLINVSSRAASGLGSVHGQRRDSPDSISGDARGLLRPRARQTPTPPLKPRAAKLGGVALAAILR